MPYYGGVDLGATSIRAVVAHDDDIVGRDRRPTPTGPTGAAVTEAVLGAIRAASRAAGVNPPRIARLGIAAIGPLDLAAGVVDGPANLPAVDRIPLSGPVGNLVGAPVTLQNDAVAGVIAERTYSDRQPDDLVYLTISTGIGAGVCVDGNVLRGWDGNAGEVGHIQLDPAGRLTCGCGIPGHWEAYCSGANIPRYARYLAEREAVGTSLPLDELTAPDVFAAADDPLAELVIERVADWNAHGVAAMVHAYAPLVVYVGGGVAINNPDRVVAPIRDRLADLVMSNVPDVRPTSLGEDAVVMGALASARSSADR